MCKMTEDVKSAEIIYGLGGSIGVFLTGCCIALTGPQDHGVTGRPTFADIVWGLGVWWVRACLPLSAMVFCKIAAWDITKRGPMVTLRISAIVFFVAVLLYVAYFWRNESRGDFDLLFVYRIILGLGCGLATTAFPFYVSEIAQTQTRGALGGFFYLQLKLGIIAAYCFLIFSSFMWICVFGLFATLLFVSSVHLKPDSPLYLMKIGQEDLAKESLIKLRGRDYDVKDEMDFMRALAKKSNESSGTLRQLFRTPEAVRALLTCVGLMFLQQFSGIHVVVLSTVPTFLKTSSHFDIRYSVIFIEAVQVFGALLAICLVDFVGRRLLLLVSAAMMTVCMLALAVCLTLKESGSITLAMLFLFALMFSFGFGPIPWIILGEVFTINFKENAMFLTTASFWLFYYLSADFYIIIRAAVGVEYLFWAFFCLLILAFLFVLYFVPEMKQKSFAEIENLFPKISPSKREDI